jgi:hypothetical protein
LHLCRSLLIFLSAALVADEFVLEPAAPFEVPGKSAPIGTFLLRPEAQARPAGVCDDQPFENI